MIVGNIKEVDTTHKLCVIMVVPTQLKFLEVQFSLI